jgi:hypothetical protein
VYFGGVSDPLYYLNELFLSQHLSHDYSQFTHLQCTYCILLPTKKLRSRFRGIKLVKQNVLFYPLYSRGNNCTSISCSVPVGRSACNVYCYFKGGRSCVISHDTAMPSLVITSFLSFNFPIITRFGSHINSHTQQYNEYTHNFKNRTIMVR